MNTEYAIAKKVLSVVKMIMSWFRKNECFDPDAMSVELSDIRLVNYATAVKVSLLVRNPGFSDLSIKRLSAELSVANYPFSMNPVPVYLHLKAGSNGGTLLSFLVTTPFLNNERVIKDISQAINHDLLLSDASVLVSIDSLSLSISRGRCHHTVELNNLRDDVRWQKSITGLHYYQQ